MNVMNEMIWMRWWWWWINDEWWWWWIWWWWWNDDDAMNEIVNGIWWNELNDMDEWIMDDECECGFIWWFDGSYMMYMNDIWIDV